MRKKVLDKDVELLKIQIYVESLNTATYTLIASLLSLTFMILFFYFGLLLQKFISPDIVGFVLFAFLSFLPLACAYQNMNKYRRKIREVQNLLTMIEQGEKLPDIEELTKDVF